MKNSGVFGEDALGMRTLVIPDREEKPYRYDYMYKGVRIDPYRIFVEYGIVHPAQQHAIKKLLRAGKSIKSVKEDIKEGISTLERWLDMLEEDVQ